MLRHRRTMMFTPLLLLVAACVVEPVNAYAEVPPLRVEVIPVAPPRMVWQPGTWHWNGRTYDWIPGRHVERGYGGNWVHGHWENRGGGRVWVPAHWS